MTSFLPECNSSLLESRGRKALVSSSACRSLYHATASSISRCAISESGFSSVPMLRHHVFVGNGANATCPIGRPSFSGLLGPDLIYLRIGFIKIRQNSIHEAELVDVVE